MKKKTILSRKQQKQKAEYEYYFDLWVRRDELIAEYEIAATKKYKYENERSRVLRELAVRIDLVTKKIKGEKIAVDPFSPAEAALWNFLLFYCQCAGGADLETIDTWLQIAGWEGSDILISLSALEERGVIEQDELGYFPIMDGREQRNMQAVKEISRLQIEPQRTIH